MSLAEIVKDTRLQSALHDDVQAASLCSSSQRQDRFAFML
jgi:hypothetical protein